MPASPSRRPRARLPRALATVAVTLLTVLLGAFVAPQPASAALGSQGIQWGWSVDWDTCQRYPDTDRMLNNADLLARTSWVRLDLRGAGGGACGDIAAKYQEILDALSGHNIKVIGLLSHEVAKGGSVGGSAADYAAAVGAVACNAAYSQVDVWEVWNEPNFTDTHLEARAYAEKLAAAVNAIRACPAASGDKIITGGVTPGPDGSPDHPVTYLDAVGDALPEFGFSSLSAAVNGIGVHPYVFPKADNDTRHAPLKAYIDALKAIGLPQYVTEYGFRLPDDNGTVDADETPDQTTQCENLVNAVNLLDGYADSVVAAATWFTLRDLPGDPSRRFGLYTEGGDPRVSLSGYLGTGCGGVQSGYYDPTDEQLAWTDPGGTALAATSYEVALARPGDSTYTLTATTTGTRVALAVFNPVLTADTYRWRVTTIRNGVRYPSPQWEFTYLGRPARPAAATASPLTANAVTVSWLDQSNNESGFEISNGSGTASVGPNATSYTWGGLAPGSTTCFTVRAVNPTGASAWTSPASCATTPALPAAPSNVAATVVTGTSVQISWTDNSGNETGFEIADDTTSQVVGTNTTSYTWGGIANGATRCFRVRAYNLGGYSPWTGNACATTPTVPIAPATPAAAAPSGTSIQVTWADKSANEWGFEISNGTTSQVVGANSTSYTWTGLANGTYMCFRVRSYNLAGYSAWTAYACATTPTIPTAPTNPTAVVVSGTAIQVGWADKSANEIGFEISNGVTSQVVGANSTFYTWGGLANGTYMCFRVRSYSLAGYSAWTAYACNTTPTVPAVPAIGAAVAINANQITVSWTDRSANETGFQLYNGVSTITLGPNSTSYTWGGLAAGTYMCFAVRAYNAAGYSAYTPYACTTTPTPPAAPTGQAAAALNSSQIRVTWQDRSANKTGFQVYDGVNTFTLGANSTVFTRTGLASRTYMCFAVRSYNAAGYSAWTPYACTTTL
ncbi:fibronectin type III domain-containing protein [Catellatospora sp. KI3]|uniref:fibronectin type III domain-containing protein n=1 Tax=Catellatospora sp. KI3 TaxID=3041620 RepID=UPI0024831C24|nr:fibronectin type III domain-containing protein [Catellatospora sp. KI3]MDI1463725.1 fibronectin type III domain-containing protein [Catellatospora sp. KI3]